MNMCCVTIPFEIAPGQIVSCAFKYFQRSARCSCTFRSECLFCFKDALLLHIDRRSQSLRNMLVFVYLDELFCVDICRTASASGARDEKVNDSLHIALILRRERLAARATAAKVAGKSLAAQVLRNSAKRCATQKNESHTQVHKAFDATYQKQNVCVCVCARSSYVTAHFHRNVLALNSYKVL